MIENRLPYSTVAGYVTRGETFNQLLDYLSLCADCCQRMSTPHFASADYSSLMSHLTLAEEAANVIGHLFATEDDPKSKLLSRGWHGIAEMLHNNKITLNHLATRPHINRWSEVRNMFTKIIHQVKKMHEGGMQ